MPSATMPRAPITGLSCRTVPTPGGGGMPRPRCVVAGPGVMTARPARDQNTIFCLRMRARYFFEPLRYLYSL